MNSDLKKFIKEFDFSKPDWDKLPIGFPNCDLGGLSMEEVGHFNAIKGLFEICGPKKEKSKDKIIAKGGGYRDLKSYQNSEIIHDFTVEFCNKYIDQRSRTNDQMVQAARSGKQNIAEGSKASSTSKRTEIKLINVARASLEELLLDYEDYLRQNNLNKWDMNDTRAKEVRALAYKSDRTYKTYMSYPESAANAAICLINQTNYLLDKQLRALEKDYSSNGGFNDRIQKMRKGKLIGRF